MHQNYSFIVFDSIQNGPRPDHIGEICPHFLERGTDNLEASVGLSCRIAVPHRAPVRSQWRGARDGDVATGADGTRNADSVQMETRMTLVGEDAPCSSPFSLLGGDRRNAG